VGQYLSEYPQPPWVIGKTETWSSYDWSVSPSPDADRPNLGPITYLGAAGVALISVESDESSPVHVVQVLGEDPARLGPFSDLDFYMRRRRGEGLSLALPELPVPDEFKQVFQDWAEGKVNFTAPD
jgi:hypothetical protein